MTKYLTIDQIIEFHEMLVEEFGGHHGIRDKNLLHSAIDAPKAAFGGQEMYISIYEKAAAYLYHLARNHPFIDGNKRTAYLATLTFLEVNEISRHFKLKDLEEIVVDVAEGKIDKKQLAIFLENGMLPEMQILLKE